MARDEEEEKEEKEDIVRKKGGKETSIRKGDKLNTGGIAGKRMKTRRRKMRK